MKRLLTLIFSTITFFCFISCPQDTSDDKDFPKKLAEYTGNKDYISENNAIINSSSVQNQSQGLEDLWWNEKSFYHIWVKSFSDSDNDGCGDFTGIKNKLDYIQNDLGCSAIWLSPIFECDYKGKSKDTNMHGYDVSNYYSVNSYFGSEEDLIELINACHERNMQIIFDFVPNHTGLKNQWFIDSAKNTNGKKNWYMWNETELSWDPDMGSTDTWHLNPYGSDYYYAAFYQGQPDLNFRNYEVREEMKNVVRYWLNKGFDGLRIDAVRYLIETKDAKFDTDETHSYYQELRRDVIDKYKDISPKFMTCEAWIENDRTNLEKYFGSKDSPEFNMVFDFDQGYGIVNAICNKNADYLLQTLHANPSAEQCYGTFIGNHDNYIDRLGTFFGGYEATIKLASGLSLLRPTVPFIYYGNEIAMYNNTTYGTGDIRLRSDFTWTEADYQKSNPYSLLNFNKALLTLRKNYPALFKNSKVEFLKSNTINTTTKESLNHAAAFIISNGSDSLLCISGLENRTDDNFWFANSSLIDFNNYSVLIGINNKKNLIEESGSLKIQSLAPYEFRVYDLTSSDKEMLFTDNRLFLRGSMNSWGYNEMTYNYSAKTFSANMELSRGTYQFKFDKYCDWSLSYGSGSDVATAVSVNLGEKTATSTDESTSTIDTNFSLTVSTSGTYRFIFNEEDETFSVSLI